MVGVAVALIARFVGVVLKLLAEYQFVLSVEYSIGTTAEDVCVCANVIVYFAVTSEIFCNENWKEPAVPGAIFALTTSVSSAVLPVSLMVVNKLKEKFFVVAMSVVPTLNAHFATVTESDAVACDVYLANVPLTAPVVMRTATKRIDAILIMIFLFMVRFSLKDFLG